jgi:hypothetical protein
VPHQEGFEEDVSLPLAEMPLNAVGHSWTVLRLAGGPGAMPSGKLGCVLRFMVKEIDPTTGEAEEEGYEDEYQVGARGGRHAHAAALAAGSGRTVQPCALRRLGAARAALSTAPPPLPAALLQLEDLDVSAADYVKAQPVRAGGGAGRLEGAVLLPRPRTPWSRRPSWALVGCDTP